MIKRILFVVLVFVVSFGIINMIHNTYAYTYEIDKSVLFYKSDSGELEEDIEKYIEDIDDYIIPNSKFDMSEYLDENYDFLLYFAMDYVIDNYEYYSDFITIGEDTLYVDRDLNDRETNKYIETNELYNITDKYFGVRDFYIVNENINSELGMVSLIDYSDREFLLSIIDVDVISNDGDVRAVIVYENDVRYSYLFRNVDGVLKIRNIEVM